MGEPFLMGFVTTEPGDEPAGVFDEDNDFLRREHTEVLGMLSDGSGSVGLDVVDDHATASDRDDSVPQSRQRYQTNRPR